VLSSVIAHGVSIPANKGISNLFDRMEKRYFPKQWAKYQEYKDDRDRELRAAGAEEGEAEQVQEQEQGGDNDNAETPQSSRSEDTTASPIQEHRKEEQ
jgi:hypothetical protein